MSKSCMASSICFLLPDWGTSYPTAPQLTAAVLDCARFAECTSLSPHVLFHMLLSSERNSSSFHQANACLFKTELAQASPTKLSVPCWQAQWLLAADVEWLALGSLGPVSGIWWSLIKCLLQEFINVVSFRARTWQQNGVGGPTVKDKRPSFWSHLWL